MDDEPNTLEEEEEVVMGEPGGSDGWPGALRRLAKTMPPDLRSEVGELLQLYALNGVRDAAAARAVAELYSPPRVTTELARMRRRVPGMALVPGATFDLEEDENGVAAWPTMCSWPRIASASASASRGTGPTLSSVVPSALTTVP